MYKGNNIYIYNKRSCSHGRDQKCIQKFVRELEGKESLTRRPVFRSESNSRIDLRI